MILGGEEMKNSRIEVRVSQEEKEKIEIHKELKNIKNILNKNVKKYLMK